MRGSCALHVRACAVDDPGESSGQEFVKVGNPELRLGSSLAGEIIPDCKLTSEYMGDAVAANIERRLLILVGDPGLKSI